MVSSKSTTIGCTKQLVTYDKKKLPIAKLLSNNVGGPQYLQITQKTLVADNIFCYAKNATVS
jgi:hypothetical protein